jgi:hypothetical protein
MSRKQAYKVGALLVVLGLVGFAGGRPEARPERLAQPTDLPDLWQWDLTRVPPPDAPAVRLVMRCRHHGPAEPAPVPPTAPLRPGDGADRTLAEDTIPEGVPDDGRLTLQLLDLRQLGLPVAEADGPLRFQGVLRLYGSRIKVVAKVAGHSVRGQPVVHPGGWAGGERPLLTFSTAGLGGHDEYTFLLSTNPDAE